MKKVFFWLFYLLFLIFFDIVLAVIRFNNSIYEFFINLNIKNEWILERLFLLMEIVFIIICITFSYLISKIKVSKKSLLIPPLVIVTIKVIVFFYFLRMFSQLDSFFNEEISSIQFPKNREVLFF